MSHALLHLPRAALLISERDHLAFPASNDGYLAVERLKTASVRDLVEVVKLARAYGDTPEATLRAYHTLSRSSGVWSAKDAEARAHKRWTEALYDVADCDPDEDPAAVFDDILDIEFDDDEEPSAVVRGDEFWDDDMVDEHWTDWE